MKKSIISVVLVLAIVLSLSVNVFAATNADWESEIDVVGAAVVNGNYYDTLQEAINNANGNVVTLLKNSTDAVTTTGNLYLDLNGFTASNVSAAKIYAYDASATTAAAGTGKLVTTSPVETLTANENARYVALKDADEGAYTVHAFTLSLTDVNLRTEQESGINYTAILTCDETLKAAVNSHGVVLSLKDMPGADFETVSTDAFTVFAGAPAGEFDSSYVYNIFKNTLNDAANTKRGEYKIYANAYLRLKDNTIVMADTENIGKAWSEGYTGVTWSLKDVMVELDAKLDNYNDQLTKIVDFYKNWKNAMASWNLTKIAAEAAKAN